MLSDIYPAEILYAEIENSCSKFVVIKIFYLGAFNFLTTAHIGGLLAFYSTFCCITSQVIFSIHYLNSRTHQVSYQMQWFFVR